MGSEAPTLYAFDARGQRMQQGPQSNPAEEVFAYTETGRLASYASSAGVSAAYDFDAAGQRVRSVVTSSSVTTTTTWTYEGLTLLSLAAERSDGATWSVTYLSDGSGRAYAGLHSAEGTTTPFLIATSDRGDVVALTDTSGETFAAYAYDPWGVPVASTVATTALLADPALAETIATEQRLRYAGYVYDPEVSMYYCSARTYDPLTRQFLSKDPAKDDGEESAYQYCGGDPVGKVDPSGMRQVRIGFHAERSNRKVILGSAWWTILHQNAAKARRVSLGGALKGLAQLSWFAYMFRQRGPWDVKTRLSSKNTYYFNGKAYEHDDIGNIHYGFIGHAFGLSLEALQGAGGAVQVLQHARGTSRTYWGWWRTYFDDPRDYASVRAGYALYSSVSRQSFKGVVYVAKFY